MQDCEVQIPTTPGERLISTRTDDGLDLDGILIGSDRPRGQPLLLWIHGFGANFYFAPYLRLARAIAAHGVASAIVNTRGHDLATLLQPERGVPYWGGGAWEKLDDAPRDLAAWLTLATDVGFSQIALAGHSLGAVKATHYLAERQDARVLGLALTSPPLRPSWDTRAYPRRWPNPNGSSALASLRRSSTGHGAR